MSQPRGGFVIYVSFLVALMLSALPLPEDMQLWRPEWVLLVLLYWIVALPTRVGLGTAWVMGILLDVLEGSLLGLNALALTIVAYVMILVYQRVRMFSWVQQVLFVFALVALNQFIAHWVKGILGGSSQSLMFLVPALVSAVLWPVLFMLLRGVRRGFNVL
ncbi:MAG: rod shape-determining protein MreD [Pseudomonadales bacterium]